MVKCLFFKAKISLPWVSVKAGGIVISEHKYALPLFPLPPSTPPLSQLPKPIDTRTINANTKTIKPLTFLIAQRQHLPLAFTNLDAIDRLDREILAGEGECFLLHVQGHWLGVAL